jgi:molybdopterin-containing oxidoreductase family iron-sulfur binding subunit
VLIDWNKCIGCKYCQVACPYGVRFFTDEKAVVQPDIRDVFPSTDRQWGPPDKGPQDDPTRGIGIQPHGVVSKCTFCYHKVSKAPKGVADLDEDVPELKEYVPGCVRVCAPKARFFGDLDNPESYVNKLIADKRGVRLKEETGNKPQVYYLSGGAPGAVPGLRSMKEKS